MAEYLLLCYNITDPLGIFMLFQALEVIRKLKAVMPIARINMLLKIICDTAGMVGILDDLYPVLLTVFFACL